MKKFLMMFVLLATVVGLMACSGGDSSKDSDKSGSKGSEDGKVTIKYYNWDNDVMGKTTKAYIEAFEKENPDIKVESVPLVPGDSVATLEKLDVLLSSGDSVDVVAFPNISELQKRASMGALEPFDDLYKEEGIDPKDEYFVNPTMDDKYYGIQFNATTNFVILNKDALDKAGLEVPKAGWTWDDFADYAEKLTTENDNGKKQYGAYFHNWSMYMNPPAQTTMKHPYLYEDGTTNFVDPTFKQMFEMRKDLEKDGYTKTYADVLGADLGYRAEFFNEEAAMLLTGSWMIGEVGDLEINPHDFVTAFAPVPVAKEGDPTDYYMGGNFVSIGKSSKNKEAAYKFARFISKEMSDARVELPGWKEADLKPLVERIISGKEEHYDVESLMNTVVGDDIGFLDASVISIDYGAELEEVLMDGFGKYMLNNEPIDDVLDWMVERAEKVIDEHSN